jgi:hypothetical protein
MEFLMNSIGKICPQKMSSLFLLSSSEFKVSSAGHQFDEFTAARIDHTRQLKTWRTRLHPPPLLPPPRPSAT